MLNETERRAMRYFFVTLLCVASAFFQAVIFVNAPAAILSVLGSVFALALYTQV